VSDYGPVVEVPRIQPSDALFGLAPSEVRVQLVDQILGLPFKREVGEVAARECAGHEQNLLMRVKLREEDVVVPLGGTQAIKFEGSRSRIVKGVPATCSAEDLH
jgi:hypothetical protein